MSSERQQVLRLWLTTSALDTGTAAWAFHDGSDGAGPAVPNSSPPYRNGVDALRDGWFLIQTPSAATPVLDGEALHRNTALEFEFVFERRV